MKLAFTAVCMLIVYGSLYPFEFAIPRGLAWQDVLRMSLGGETGRGDILGNILLFVPFSLVGTLAYCRPPGGARTCFWIILGGTALSMGCQIAQIIVPGRTPALADVGSNLAGMALGLAAGFGLMSRSPRRGGWSTAEHRIPLVLLGAWLVARLAPFAPSIDLQSIMDSLKPAFLFGRIEWSELALGVGSWTAAAHLALGVIGRAGGWMAAPVLTAAVLGLEVLIVQNQVTSTDMVAAAAALLLGFALRNDARLRASVVVGLLLAGFLVSSLLPLRPAWESAPFGWLPFEAYLQGGMLPNMVVFATKIFVFGAILWLLCEAGLKLVTVTGALTALVLGVEIAQTDVAEGTPDITDPILVLAVGFMLRFRGDGRATSLRSVPEPVLAAREPRHGDGAWPDAPAAALQSAIVPALVGMVLCVAALFVVVRIPGVPYNVRELFLFGASGPDLAIFSLALVWIGFGTAWAGAVTARSGIRVLVAPAAAIGISVVLYLLLRLSVTEESIRDIAGSSVFVHRLSIGAVFGEGGVRFLDLVGADMLRPVTEVVEPAVRFGALWAPFLIFLQLAFAVLFMTRAVYGLPSLIAATSRLLLYMLPWLILAKAIAFDWSSTDNLNELIARDGEYGLGGGGYLYALTALISACGAAVAWSLLCWGRAGRFAALIATAASVPLGWWLLNNGLAERVQKYGSTFSGVDFILGPDRQHLIPDSELFLRWALVQIALTAVLVCGGLVFLRLRAATSLHWVAPEAPAADDARPIPLIVRLRPDQVDFLQKLSQTINASIATTVEEVLVNTFRKAEQNEDTMLDLKKEMAGERERSVPPIQMIDLRIELSKGTRRRLGHLCNKATVSESRAIRRLVAHFMAEHSRPIGTEVA